MSTRMEGHATRKSTPEERERLVDLLRPYQLAKLEENVHKGHWGHEDPMWLHHRLEEEVKELEDAIRTWRASLLYIPSMRHPLTPQEAALRVRREAADVCNFAAMIADVVK